MKLRLVSEVLAIFENNNLKKDSLNKLFNQKLQ